MSDNLRLLAKYSAAMDSGDTDAVYEFWSEDFHSHVTERVSPERLGSDVGDQANPVGHRRTERQRHEGIQGVVAPSLEPSVRRRRVIGESDSIESCGFGRPGKLGNGCPAHELGTGRMGDQGVGDGEFHSGLRAFRMPPMRRRRWSTSLSAAEAGLLLGKNRNAVASVALGAHRSLEPSR